MCRFGFTRQSKRFSKAFVPIYFSTVSVSEFLLLHILASIWYNPTVPLNFFFATLLWVKSKLYLLLLLLIDFRERGKERGGETETETLSCCSIYLRIHWLIPVCTPTQDWTCKLGVLGQHSGQLSSQPGESKLYSELHGQCLRTT